MQAEIARAAGRPMLAANFERAAELVDVPQDFIMSVYELLRPGRAKDKTPLLEAAQTLRETTRRSAWRASWRRPPRSTSGAGCSPIGSEEGDGDELDRRDYRSHLLPRRAGAAGHGAEARGDGASRHRRAEHLSEAAGPRQRSRPRSRRTTISGRRSTSGWKSTLIPNTRDLLAALPHARHRLPLRAHRQPDASRARALAQPSQARLERPAPAARQTGNRRSSTSSRRSARRSSWRR